MDVVIVGAGIVGSNAAKVAVGTGAHVTVLDINVERLRRTPLAPCSARPYDLALSLGDTIDNAQRNELDTFLAIVAGGRTRLSAYGSAQDASAELGPSPWPFWSPLAWPRVSP